MSPAPRIATNPPFAPAQHASETMDVFGGVDITSLPCMHLDSIVYTLYVLSLFSYTKNNGLDPLRQTDARWVWRYVNLFNLTQKPNMFDH